MSLWEKGMFILNNKLREKLILLFIPFPLYSSCLNKLQVKSIMINVYYIHLEIMKILIMPQIEK